jgi:hypothetical protein
MKKILLAVLSIFLLSGCQQSAPLIKEDPAPIDLPVTELPKGHSAETVTYENETGTYIIKAEYPKLDYTEQINQEIKTKIDTEIELFIEEANSLELTAEAIAESGFGKSGLYLNYAVYLLTDDYISLSLESSIYNSGAAHPYSYTEVFNYDVKNKKDILLVDMFVPDTMFWEAISATVIPKIKDKLYKDEFADENWISEGAGPDSKNFEAFNITENGFVFHFFPYQVAAYAAGPQAIEVKFEELGAILMPGWQ